MTRIEQPLDPNELRLLAQNLRQAEFLLGAVRREVEALEQRRRRYENAAKAERRQGKTNIPHRLLTVVGNLRACENLGFSVEELETLADTVETNLRFEAFTVNE